MTELDFTNPQTLDIRSRYVATVRQMVPAARAVYETIRPYLRETRALQIQRDELTATLGSSDTASVDFSAIARQLTRVETRLERLAINRPEQALEKFRVDTNEIRAKASQALIEIKTQPTPNSALEALTHPDRIIQIGRIRPNIAVHEPGSPNLPHHDLGQLAIHRTGTRNTRLTPDIALAAADSWKDDRDKERIALTLVQLLPVHIIQGTEVPVMLRSNGHLAKGLVELTQMVLDIYQGRFSYPDAIQLGTNSPEQNSHIQRFLQANLCGTLIQELSSPDITEKGLRQMFQRFNNGIRDLAKWISTGNNVDPSYERVGKIIEEMPHDVQCLMTVSRLSVNLYKDLGFPAAEFISVVRFAELLRDTSFIPNKLVKFDTLAQLLGVLTERWQAGDLDIHQLFEQLSSLPYGASVIANLVDFTAHDYWRIRHDLESQTVDPDEVRDDLLLLLSETHHFRVQVRKLREQVPEETLQQDLGRDIGDTQPGDPDDGYFGYHPLLDYSDDND